ncbi:hypothetical protein GCM10022254_05940 [Actinomadura meridiana]|uniref:Thiopeptide-type bacteriocin biosynthesis domain-containing protein n=1 Tax=Actinomadura meridiana TaxID=559626 RepID=A0ABP8BU34_9ACTN
MRIRTSDATEYGRCVGALGLMAAWLRSTGVLRHLELDTYYPEAGRYGTGTVLAAAEKVFAVDSRAAILQLQVPKTAARPTALVAASFVDIVRGFAGTDGMRWLLDRAHTDEPAPVSREDRHQVLALTAPDAIRALPDGGNLAAAWAERREALGAYHAALTVDQDSDAVLASLLHMHHIRVVGLDHESERRCRRLARAVALAARHREGGCL